MIFMSTKEKTFLREAGILIPQGDIAYCGDQAVQVAKPWEDPLGLSKRKFLQGRGKAGVFFLHTL